MLAQPTTKCQVLQMHWGMSVCFDTREPVCFSSLPVI